MTDIVPRPAPPRLLPPADPLPLERNPAAVFLASRHTESTRRAYARDLATIAELLTSGAVVDPLRLPWHRLRFQHTEALSARLLETRAPSTVNRHLSALRGVLRSAWRLGLMEAEDYHRAVDLKSVKSTRLPAGRALKRRELARLFDACADGTPGGARNAALLALLVGAGLRRSEAVALNLEDYELETGALRILDAKGRKDRLVYATNGTSDALEAWLEVRGTSPGPLLVPITRRGAVEVESTPDGYRPRGMTAQSAYDALQRVARRAGVSAFTPHDLRRTAISDLLDAGADLTAVQALAGHASPTTTARYDRRGEEAKRKAAKLHFIPYRRERA